MLASVDGCKGGWLVAISESWPCKEQPILCVCVDFRALLYVTRECRVVVVDIPIGLPDGKTSRQCDIEARMKLSKNGQSRVFLTPPRSCLQAKSPEEFQERHKIICKKGAGLPVWGILPKLKQADEAMEPDKQDRIYEFHPELAWVGLAKRALESKHSEGGRNEREGILNRFVPGLNCIIAGRKHLGRAAALDDIFDALVGLSVARRISDKEQPPCRLPTGRVPTDSRGLRMEIWY
jgi:predicted RNase H-like nuclease